MYLEMKNKSKKFLKMNNDDINDYVPSILNPRSVKKNADFSLTQKSIISRCSLSLKRHNIPTINKDLSINKENCQSLHNLTFEKEINFRFSENVLKEKSTDELKSSPFLFSRDLNDLTYDINSNNSSHYSFDIPEEPNTIANTENLNPIISLSFAITDCDNINISTKNTNLRKILFSHKNDAVTVDCDVAENSLQSLESQHDENMNETVVTNSLKRSATVNLEIKNKKLPAENTEEKSKVLILKTDAIARFSHVIVQPPKYKLLKRQISEKNKFKSTVKRKFVSRVENGKNLRTDHLKQTTIDSYFGNNSFVEVPKQRSVIEISDDEGIIYDSCEDSIVHDGVQEMSRNSSVFDAIKCNRRPSFRSNRKDSESTSKSAKVLSKNDNDFPRISDNKGSCSDAPRVPSPRSRTENLSIHSTRRNIESLQFNIPTKLKTNRTSLSLKNIPHYKIVAGTHFAVDAFSYGEIPNVKHYFLTHFHSDHYSGLKKSFNKLLFCSKITADLCISNLGVNPKCIHLMNLDETIRVDGAEVTAVDANHCPGAIMLIFTLPNGKTILHTGDFRASPAMESCPIFWNKEIHTIYLDTTYCNPRYDFPTQEQSLEMALYLLRRKKLTVEKAGKQFSSVLIVCGTYTIGKEKFFLGIARRVGCSIWACPEKDRALQAVEGRSFGHIPSHSCQLHVLPMRDLTYERLRSYLDSLQGAFSEVVAFKPSGWENGKNSTIEKEMVTIHGIPYSEHSSFSEMIRFVKFLKPKQVVPIVDISGGTKAVQKYFPCPLIYKEDMHSQSRMTDFFSIQTRQQVPAVT